MAMLTQDLLNGLKVREDFDRIVDAGGIFIIFANRWETQKFTVGTSFERRIIPQRSKEISNYEFLTATSYINCVQIGSDHGSEVLLGDDLFKYARIAPFLSKHRGNAQYSCTAGPGTDRDQEWITLFKNKYDDPLGGVLLPNAKRAGSIFIFPVIQDKPSFLADFIEQFLPEMAPKLFPDFEQGNWVNLQEYELPDDQATSERD